ncbi:MAG: PAS domain-containing protein [Euryarchaeota archaeon]|nr:PAS domain-containing protein [Euryarchaeota archaeon]
MSYECQIEDNTWTDSVEMYKTIFDNSAIAITLTDGQERIVFWNKYAEELLGMKRDDLHMKPVSSLYPPEEWQKIRAENIRQKGIHYHIETKMLKKNNELVDVDISLSVLKNKEGTVIGSIGLIKDITDRKRAEEKLGSEHNLLQTLLDAIPDSIYFKDENSRFILVNKAKAAHSHIQPSDMIGKTDHDFLPAADAQKVFEDDQKIIQTGTALINKIEKLTHSDGSEKWLSVTKLPRYNAQGKIIGTMGISREVTEWKIAENQSKRNYDLLQTLLDNVPDSIYFKDEWNRFILVNKAKASHWNVTPEAMNGKTDYDFLPENQARKSFEDDLKVIHTGQSIIAEIEKITGNDKSERWVSVTKIPRYDTDGKIIGTMGISRDITKQVHETKETEKYKQVAIGHNLRMIELRDKVKELVNELEKE